MSFLETVGAQLLYGVINSALTPTPGQQGQEEPSRQHKPIKKEAAQNLLGGGPAPIRYASGLQGMRPSAVQQGASNLYNQRSSYMG
jgi:hypothetical protein